MTTTFLRCALILAALAGSAALAQPAAHVRVLATGGTISGAGSANSNDYRAGVLTGDDLVKTVPGADTVATISTEQVANIASGNMNEAIWRKLLASVEAGLADPGVTGIVITHGTDTLEETAFLLDLLLPAGKPIVMVGSMRPSSAVSADGPQNLLDAMKVAVSPEAVGRGVLVVMNDTIFEPRSVTKVDVRRVEAFAAPSRGPVGDVVQVTPRFYAPASARGAAFTLGAAKLPRVAIVHAYAGITGDDVLNAAKDAAGVVIAGVGAGGVPSAAREALRTLAARGIPVVRTPRQGHGDIWRSDSAPGSDNDGSATTIAGRELTPAKARILLMLALQQPRSTAELQALFDRFGTR